MVDYICVPHETLSKCSDFKVLTAQEIASDNDLLGLLGQRARLPDHSALVTEFQCRDYNTNSNDNSNPTSTDNVRFKLRCIPPDFMQNERVATAIISIISQIESARENQEDIDSIYSNLCNAITDEMKAHIPTYNASKKTNKRRKVSKPYWCDELQQLWDVLRIKERSFVKYKGNNQQKSILRLDYVNARNRFDKQLRQSERVYRAAEAFEIEDMSCNNPTEFWRKIQNLGSRKDNSIPIEIVDNGNIIRNERTVFERWRLDFSNLYNGDNNGDFNEEHYDRAKLHKHLLEMNMQDPLYVSNEQMNRNISIEELTTIIMHARSGSACGHDNIPYEVLKFPAVIVTLQHLFQLIFDSSLIPSCWRKAIICPILKDHNSDRRVPLNYRGVSLLTCTSKLYSAFLNKRITTYLDNDDILADEQNRFRAGRSCEDHIYTLNSIIRNNNSVFASFIDLKKCFDFIDRDMLLYKLLLHRIDGKVYNSIRNIYTSATSCIRINNKLTDWFSCDSGVKQGCCLSPTLFAIFANDLVKEINDLDLGISVAEANVSILMYADDIVLVSNNEEKLQIMLNTLHDWCKRWRVIINTNKSKTVHFRRGRTSRTDKEFRVGENILETVAQYRYLGVIFDERNDFSANCEALAKGAGRALGSLISKIHNMKHFRFQSFEKLYTACITPILEYSASVWGSKTYQFTRQCTQPSIKIFHGRA